jgi:hypothetical protein
MATRTNDEAAATQLRNVAILRPGSYRDLSGRAVEFSEADLRAIALAYDPQYHRATVNLDHSDSGPALGQVTALRFDNGHLWADITGLPDWFAAQLAAGRWPSRSAEIWSDLDGRGPYLRGLAFLGARAPAVRGLPPLPTMNSALANASQGALISILMEGEMDTVTGLQDAAALKRLADDNRRLTSQLADYRRRETEDGVDALLTELRETGRLTPGMEGVGLRELLVSLGGSETCIMLGEGEGEETSLYDCLEALLRNLPVQELDNELAAEHGSGGYAALSAFERDIAASLGLTDTEYAQIRSERTA